VHGILVIDKPAGPTSHDVVARVRRALRTREVGHAGTLDPFATGVLVVAIGEATKLVQYLTADDKVYEATITLGRLTHTLDCTGETVEEAPVPELSLAQVQAATEPFLGVQLQRAPAVSAIKVDGVALHARVRRGEIVEAPERSVTLYRCDVLEVSGDRIRVVLHTGKGFYVRSFARDLAEALGTVGHVSELRRTRSGRFSLDVSVRLETLKALGTETPGILSLAEACGCLPTLTLDAEGEVDARCGRPVALTKTSPREGTLLDTGTRAVLFSMAGEPVAIAERTEDEKMRVVRGFALRE
jgi:tRNA pseudouridine55 synthase